MPILILTTIAIALILYKRYVPVFGAHCTNVKDLFLEEFKVIDIGDFNDSYKNPIKGAAFL